MKNTTESVQTKEELVNHIKALINDLDTLFLHDDKASFKLSTIVENMITKLEVLHSYDQSLRCDQLTGRLRYTLTKEIDDVHNAFMKKNKKDTSQNHYKYRESLKKAITQVKDDINECDVLELN